MTLAYQFSLVGAKELTVKTDVPFDLFQEWFGISSGNQVFFQIFNWGLKVIAISEFWLERNGVQDSKMLHQTKGNISKGQNNDSFFWLTLMSSSTNVWSTEIRYVLV